MFQHNERDVVMYLLRIDVCHEIADDAVFHLGSRAAAPADGAVAKLIQAEEFSPWAFRFGHAVASYSIACVGLTKASVWAVQLAQLRRFVAIDDQFLASSR